MPSQAILKKLLISRFLFSDLFPVSVPRCQYLIICHDNDRAYSYRGLAYSQLLDTLRDNLVLHGIVVATVAQPWSIMGSTKATGSPVLTNGPYTRNIALSMIECFFTGYNLKHKIVQRMLKWWLVVLREARPSVVIGIQPSESLCVAGKKLGIPIYDLQHGVIELSNNSSSYYSDRLGTFFNREGTPDLVVCWSDQSARIIESMWPWSRTLVAGNPWLQRFVTPEGDSLAMSEIRLLQQRLSSCLTKKIVLITTQWVPALDRIDIPDRIREAILYCCAQDIQWLIKFHPVEVAQLGQSRVSKLAADVLGRRAWDKIIDVSSHALPAILQFVDYHVTGASASTHEASALGIKTGLWENSQEVAKWFCDDLNNGLADFLPSDGKQISSKIIDEISA